MEELKLKLAKIISEATREIVSINKEVDLNHFKSKYLNPGSEIHNLKATVKDQAPKERGHFGKALGAAEKEITSLIEQQKNVVFRHKYETRINPDLSAITYPQISEHLLLKTRHEVEAIFNSIGYTTISGTEVETVKYNFDQLNLPPDHPARSATDTFYFNDNLLLRTHCSNMQARMLEQSSNQSIKMISTGKVYRRDDDDATHSHQFMQLDGFLTYQQGNSSNNFVANLSDLYFFIHQMFGQNKQIRLRASYFPFTSPSYEIDMSCFCETGCSICKGTSWIEVLGCGMIHPNVLKNANFIEEYSGFAFGIGIERIAMLKYNISDVREFYQNDLDFLRKEQ